MNKLIKQILIGLLLNISNLNLNYVLTQSCSITYQQILSSLAEKIDQDGCSNQITIFDRCLTQTINKIKNQQQQPFQPFILPQEGSVQNIQFLLQQDFNYLTVQSQEIFFNCIIRKQSINVDNENPTPAATPEPPTTPTTPDPNPQNPYDPTEPTKLPVLQNTVERFGCENFSFENVGKYRYVNNQWGKDKAPLPPQQCLLKGQNSDGDTYYGWEWKYSGCDFSVFAYPEVLFGNKPWSNEGSTEPEFSGRIQDFKKLNIHFETQSKNLGGTYNLALELWTTDIPKTGNEAIIDNIKTEVMWIIDIAGLATPAGNKIGEVNVDGVTWNLSRLERNDGVFWDFYTFSTQYDLCEKQNDTSICKFNIQSMKFFDYLIDNGFANQEEYIDVVELGNEVMGNCDNSGTFGTGQTFVTKFQIDYEK